MNYLWGFVAQVEPPATQPFFERLLSNDTLRETTPTGWAVLLGGIFLGVTLGKIAGASLRSVSAKLAARGWLMRSIVTGSFAGPANLAIIGAGISIGIGQLAPSPQLSGAAEKGLALLYMIAIAWLLYNIVELVAAGLRSVTSKTESKLDDQLVPLISKTLRIFMLIIMTLFAAENIFHANIGAWLAGLGIAGLAVSLAAQDSIKNVFGSMTILMDQPFSQGDFVKMSSFTGTVEEVGFRSTRLRTPEGSLVTMPNSEVANSPIDNLSRRPSIRRVIDVALTYDTTPEKLRQAIALMKEILAEPEIAGAFDLEKEPPRVYLDEINAGSINIKVFYWFTPPEDYWAFLAHSEKVNLQILGRLGEAGIDLAFPTRTLMLASDPKRPLEVRQVVNTLAS